MKIFLIRWWIIDLAVWSEINKTVKAILQGSTLRRSVQWYHAQFWKYSKALMSQHPRYAKNQVTGAGHLQEFKNTELVWKLRKTGFYVQWYHAQFWKYSKALMSQHPRYAKNQVTGAGHLQEFKNTELVWKLRKTGFYEGGR